jgi:hypothetical protein
MTHLPFIAGSYALGILIPAGFALSAYLRLGAARRRLAAIDPRARPGAGSRGRPGVGPRLESGAPPRAEPEATS